MEEFAASGLKINSFDFAANSLQNLEQVGNRRLPYKFMSKFKSFSLSRSLSLSLPILFKSHTHWLPHSPPPPRTHAIISRILFFSFKFATSCWPSSTKGVDLLSCLEFFLSLFDLKTIGSEEIKKLFLFVVAPFLFENGA